MKEGRFSRQVAAVPIWLDERNRVEVCLITSRSTSRWIIPKGWPMKGLRDDEAAAVEAREEAGLVGRTFRQSIGSYTYWRRTRKDFRLTRVDVYALLVKRRKKRWKEQGQRKIVWVSLLDAADMVLEPELSTLLINIPNDTSACEFLSKGKAIEFR